MNRSELEHFKIQFIFENILGFSRPQTKFSNNPSLAVYKVRMSKLVFFNFFNILNNYHKVIMRHNFCITMIPIMQKNLGWIKGVGAF